MDQRHGGGILILTDKVDEKVKDKVRRCSILPGEMSKPEPVG